MGRRGPKPEPTAIRMMKGNPSKRPLNDSEPKFAGAPRCPDWLGQVGRAKWEEIVPVLLTVDGMLTEADSDMLALYCDTWQDYLLAGDDVATRGITVESEKTGAVYQNPAMGIKNKKAALLKQLAALFGLSPADRAALKLAPPQEHDDEFSQMMKARGA